MNGVISGWSGASKLGASSSLGELVVLAGVDGSLDNHRPRDVATDGLMLLYL